MTDNLFPIPMVHIVSIVHRLMPKHSFLNIT